MEDNNNEKSLEEGLFISDKLSRARKYVRIRGCYGPIFYFFAVIPPPSCWLYMIYTMQPDPKDFARRYIHSESGSLPRFLTIGFGWLLAVLAIWFMFEWWSYTCVTEASLDSPRLELGDDKQSLMNQQADEDEDETEEEFYRDEAFENVGLLAIFLGMAFVGVMFYRMGFEDDFDIGALMNGT